MLYGDREIGERAEELHKNLMNYFTQINAENKGICEVWGDPEHTEHMAAEEMAYMKRVLDTTFRSELNYDRSTVHGYNTAKKFLEYYRENPEFREALWDVLGRKVKPTNVGTFYIDYESLPQGGFAGPSKYIDEDGKETYRDESEFVSDVKMPDGRTFFWVLDEKLRDTIPSSPERAEIMDFFCTRTVSEFSSVLRYLDHEKTNYNPDYNEYIQSLMQPQISKTGKVRGPHLEAESKHL